MKINCASLDRLLSWIYIKACVVSSRQELTFVCSFKQSLPIPIGIYARTGIVVVVVVLLYVADIYTRE